MVGTGRSAKTGILLKMAQFYRKSKKVQTVVLIRQNLTEGKPVVTDAIGDEGEVLSLAATKIVFPTPASLPIVNRASELGISLHPVETSKPCMEKA